MALLEDDPPAAGDWVLIHVGFALAKLDEDEAQATLEMLEGMAQAYQDELAAIAASASVATAGVVPASVASAGVVPASVASAGATRPTGRTELAARAAHKA